MYFDVKGCRLRVRGPGSLRVDGLLPNQATRSVGISLSRINHPNSRYLISYLVELKGWFFNVDVQWYKVLP